MLSRQRVGVSRAYGVNWAVAASANAAASPFTNGALANGLP
ncbi:MAG TPA: hypothetical protein VLM79_21385 [Kofleriaceae bacterium]|nr:hypothetical protein [Kofleriaceae bacterium]